MRDRKPPPTTKLMASSAPRPRRESRAPAGQQPEQAHRPAGTEVAERDRAPHYRKERGAADQHHVGKKEEIERERHEEERLADQRQTLLTKSSPLEVSSPRSRMAVFVVITSVRPMAMVSMMYHEPVPAPAISASNSREMRRSRPAAATAPGSPRTARSRSVRSSLPG